MARDERVIMVFLEPDMREQLFVHALCHAALIALAACSSPSDDGAIDAATIDGSPAFDAPATPDADVADAAVADASPDAMVDATVDAAADLCMAPTPPATCPQGLATGSDHTCAVKNGQVFCWGVNGANGVLGHDNTVDVTVTTPVQVVGLSGIVALTAAANSTCALRDDTTVWCWGDGSQGQMGNGTAIGPNPVPVQVQGVGGVDFLTDIVALSSKSSGSHFCALSCTGTSYCWGNNAFGQAADGTRGDDKLTPVATLFGPAQGISAGTQNSCAALMDDTFECAGFNGDGQLGNGTTGLETGVPQPVATIVGTQVAVGNLDTCAILDVGTVSCWGANNQGQHGNNAAGMGSAVPTPTDAALVDVGSLSAATHVCAISNTGALSCWGRNNLGQVGDGTLVSVDVPRVIGLGGNLATLVGTSRNHTCAGLDNEEVWCWGKNTFGQLGRGATSPNEPSPAAATAFSCQ